jgi:flagellar brake protein
MPLDAPTSRPAGLREFRIDKPQQIRDLMRGLHDGCIEVHLSASCGVTIATTVWTLDSQRETMHFLADEDEPELLRLLADPEVIAVTTVDHVKIQFDVPDLMIVRGPGTATLSASFPPVVYRFQRRTGLRVKGSGRALPMARLRHPQMPDLRLQLRVLDISLAGCGLLLPIDVPPIEPGTLFNRVQIDLNVSTRLDTGLRLHHVSSMGHDAIGMRLGCSLAGLAGDSLRLLQRHIEQAQRRQRQG